MSMQEDIRRIRGEAMQALADAASLADLAQWRVAVLGKKGSLTGLLRSMGQVDPALRPQVGQWINAAREELEAQLAQRKTSSARPAPARWPRKPSTLRSRAPCPAWARSTPTPWCSTRCSTASSALV